MAPLAAFASVAAAMPAGTVVLSEVAAASEDPYSTLVSAGIVMFAVFCGVVWTLAEEHFLDDGPSRAKHRRRPAAR